MIDKKLSSIIQYKLPEFVRDQNEMFVAFIQAYYQFLEEDGNYLHYIQRFRRNLDVDIADDDFILSYLSEFAPNLPIVSSIPKPDLLKMMKEYYLARGSEDSFRFIFRILYDVDIDIIYPHDSVFTLSDGEYSSRSYVHVTAVNASVFEDLSNFRGATITGKDTSTIAVIENIVSVFVTGERLLRLEISSSDGQFQINEDVVLVIDGVSVTERIISCVSHVDILDGGINYRIGDFIYVNDPVGMNATIRISNVTKAGYTEYSILNSGAGYNTGDLVVAPDTTGSGFVGYVNEVDDSGAVLSILIESFGHGYDRFSEAQIISVSGSGALIELRGKNGSINSISVESGGIGYSNDSNIKISTSTGSGFIGSVVLSSVFQTPKSYRKNRSTISDNNRLTDSYYYQQHSYVVASAIPPHTWLDTIKRLNHPVGTELFGMYRMESEVGLSIDVAENDPNGAYDYPIIGQAYYGDMSSDGENLSIKYDVVDGSIGYDSGDDILDFNATQIGDLTIIDVESGAMQLDYADSLTMTIDYIP